MAATHRETVTPKVLSDGGNDNGGDNNKTRNKQEAEAADTLLLTLAGPMSSTARQLTRCS